MVSICGIALWHVYAVSLLRYFVVSYMFDSAQYAKTAFESSKQQPAANFDVITLTAATAGPSISIDPQSASALSVIKETRT